MDPLWPSMCLYITSWLSPQMYSSGSTVKTTIEPFNKFIHPVDRRTTTGPHAVIAALRLPSGHQQRLAAVRHEPGAAPAPVHGPAGVVQAAAAAAPNLARPSQEADPSPGEQRENGGNFKCPGGCCATANGIAEAGGEVGAGPDVVRAGEPDAEQGGQLSSLNSCWNLDGRSVS